MKRTSDHEQKREAIKKRWIKAHMANPQLDYDIIFKTDDEIHGHVKMQFSFQGKDAQGGAQQAKKTGSKDYSDHSKMKAQDWELAFNTLLELHLIEVTPDYYQDELYFTNTKVLKDLFDKLELDNLQMIHQ